MEAHSSCENTRPFSLLYMLRLRAVATAKPRIRLGTPVGRPLSSILSPSGGSSGSSWSSPSSSSAAKKPPSGATTLYQVNDELFNTFRKIIVKIQSDGAPLDVNNIKPDPSKSKEELTLYERQVRLEEEQRSHALDRQAEMFTNLKDLGRGTSVKRVQRCMVEWYEPFQKALLAEINLIESGEVAQDRSKYGPYLLLLPPEQLVVLALDMSVSCIFRSGNAGVPTANLAMDIGALVETEVNLRKVKLSKENYWAKRLLKEKPQETMKIYRKLKMIVKDLEAWSWDVRAKVGAALLKLMLNSVRDEKGEHVFLYSCNFNPQTQKKQGQMRIASHRFSQLDTSISESMIPRFLPMVVPPQNWNNREYYGAYLRLKAPLMKHTSKLQIEAARKADMKPILQSLDYLGKTPWRINNRILDVALEARRDGLRIGEMPSNVDLESMDKDAFLEKFFTHSRSEEIQAKLEAKLKSTTPEAIEKEKDVLYRQWMARVEKKNAELHSLRCDMQIKLSIAEQFRDQRIYFPHNMDFRGRAYPIPPNLTHLGSDLCRGLLLFDEAKTLGHDGWAWLRTHLCNLFGNNKISFDERVQWTDQHMSKILESARNPLGGEMWWSHAESPFQALATCIEIANASELEDPTRYKCRLPVHQDGSCNGLQHYAGLGRDALGGKAVNLVAGDSPQDVYSEVLTVVQQRIEDDLRIPEDSLDVKLQTRRRMASMVKDVVNRKVIKQTVMTSVYGVTRIGARQQIQARLTEVFQKDTGMLSADEEREIYLASNYVADLTLVSLHQMFDSAKQIMDWLTLISHLVSQQGQSMSWITPLGLPVIQPYRREAHYAVKTALQNVILTINNDFLPVAPKKQKSAFPPNFVHSLDATHMLLTGLKMKEAKLTFAAVHDSYWTHACDVGQMNRLLREGFVELYNYPVLESLKETIEMRFPNVDVPEVPQRGSLKIEEVLNSKYFFH